MRAGYTGESAMPYGAFEASLCERFHCLPSQIDGEDAVRLLRGIELLNIYEVFQKMSRGVKLDPHQPQVGAAQADP